MAWKWFGKGSSVASAMSKWTPQIEEMSEQLEEIEHGLEQAPEQGEQYLSGLEQIQGQLKEIPKKESASDHLGLLIQKVDHAITAIRSHDYSGALAAVKQAVVVVHQVLQEIKS